MAVRMPAILNGQLKPEKPLKAVSLSLTVSLRDFSQARLTVSRSEQPVKTRSFINLYTEKGSAGVYRVTSQETSSEQGRSYTLTHAIDTLRDSAWNTQQTFEGTFQAFWTTLLYYQKTEYWQLGTVEKGGIPYKAAGLNYPKLSAAFTKFFQDNPNFYPEYDFSTTPWTLNIRELTEEVKGRFSVTRNAENCKITYNDKYMCNRLYLSVSTPEKVNGITKYDTMLKTYENAESIAEYGIIEQTAAVKTEDIKDGDYAAWANDFLKKYAQPECSVTVDAYEIWKQTGEIYDEAVVGKRARVHLPEHGVTTVQRIESIQYTDLIKSPRAIVVSLATKQKTFTSTIANLEKEVEKVGGVAGGAALSAANAEEVYAWSLIMQKVEEAVDSTGIITLYETGIIIDAESGAKIYSLEQGFQSAFSEITINSKEIAAQSELIKLKANLILLDGLVKATELQASVANMLLQNSLVIKTPNLQANEAVTQFLNTTSFTFGNTLMSKKQIEMGTVKSGPVVSESTASLNLSHSHAVTVNDTDGTITMGAPVTTEEAGNFRIADTKTYKDGVSAAKASVTLSSAGWINGVNTVVASNEERFPVSLPAFSASAGAFNSDHKATVYFSTESVQTPLKSIEVDASGVYDAGYAEGWAAAKSRFHMEWPDQGAYDYLLDIYQPGDIPDGDDVMDEIQIGATYSLNEITNTAPNTFYTSGWAYARTRLNGGSWTNRHRVNMTQTTTINVGQG